MSWHHGDYIDLLSSIGGIASAAFAAYATWQAKKSTELSKQSIQENNRQASLSNLTDELVRLADRCNTGIGENSLVKKEYSVLVEILTALTIARQAINAANIPKEDRDNSTCLFIRHLRPGIRHEIKNYDVLLQIPTAMSEDVLRQQYRDAQIFLDIDNPRHLPDPKVARP